MGKTDLENLKLAVSRLDSISPSQFKAYVIQAQKKQKQQQEKEECTFTLNNLLEKLTASAYCNLDEYRQTREISIPRYSQLQEELEQDSNITGTSTDGFEDILNQGNY